MKNIACMYLRLSREDGDSSESNSIQIKDKSLNLMLKKMTSSYRMSM